MKIEINKHSSIKLIDEKVIYFDPFELDNEPHDADIVFFTHSHYDHLSPEDLEKVAKAAGAEGMDMYAPLLPLSETADFCADGIHPEGGACKVIAAETAKRLSAADRAAFRSVAGRLR